MAHWGGRYIWQIPASGKLLVAWRTVDAGENAARAYEIRLMAHFREHHDGSCRLPTSPAELPGPDARAAAAPRNANP